MSNASKYGQSPEFQQGTVPWEHRLDAINGLARAELHMRKPGDWYVSQGSVEVSNGRGMLRGVSGNGTTPEAAVADHWRQLTELAPREVVVVNALGTHRRQ
jgi:hypothetical protein